MSRIKSKIQTKINEFLSSVAKSFCLVCITVVIKGRN